MSNDELRAGQKLILPAHINRHVVQTMRLKAGDSLQLSDGNGLRVQAVMADPEAGLAEAVKVGRGSEPLTHLALIQVLTKIDHDEQITDMAAQIGADQVVPWQVDRSIAKWKVGRIDKKWNSVLDTATEQSRRAFKPQLEAYASSKEVVAICRKACVCGDVVIVSYQDAIDTWSGMEEKIAQLVGHTPQDNRLRTVSMAIGPEGGVSKQEIADLVKVGTVSYALGRNTLRAATVGPVALSLLSRVSGRYRQHPRAELARSSIKPRSMTSESDDCLFYKIIAKQIPSNKVYENETTYAFNDINPKAKVHMLVVPKKHYANVAELATGDPTELAHIVSIAQNIADKGFRGAYRLVFNTGLDIGQIIFHVHAHMMTGRKLDGQ